MSEGYKGRIGNLIRDARKHRGRTQHQLADLLAKKGNYPEARKHAQVAWDLGQKSPNFFFKDAVQKALADWKDKK